MTPQVDYKEGQYIIYKGHQAKVVRTEPCSNYIYIEFGGECIRVDKRYGIFDFNNEPIGDAFSKRIKDEVDADIDKRIASSDEYIARKEAEKTVFEKIEEAAKETQKKCSRAIRNILDKFNATNEKGIQDASKQKEYLALLKDSSQARRTEIRANNDIYSTNNSILSERFSEHKWINTKTVVDAIANS